MARDDEESDQIEFYYYQIVARTDKAILFDLGTEEVWLPSSLIEINPDEEIVTMPVWLGRKKGLI